MFLHTRRSVNGVSIPSWLTNPGPVYLKRVDRSSKYDPLVEEVQLVKCNPHYAHIVHADGREECVNFRRLAPKQGETPLILDELEQNPAQNNDDIPDACTESSDPEEIVPQETSTQNSSTESENYAKLICKQQRTHPYNLRNREV